MPVKRYGIYMFYSPATDLRGEGLGRYLSALLKSAEDREDIRFALACPSWMRRRLSALCREEGVDETSFDIIAPEHRPLILDLIEGYRNVRKVRGSPGPVRRALRRIRRGVGSAIEAVERWLVGNRSLILFIGFVLLMIPLALLVVLAQILLGGGRFLAHQIGRLHALVMRSGVTSLRERLDLLMAHPSRDGTGRRLFQLMEQTEIAKVHELIRRETDVTAWYCPTSFWPHFNQIEAPRVICVPDVVVTDFPSSYALVSGKPGFEAFRAIETTIGGGTHFITYSDHIKWHTLVDRYQVDPDLVFVIRHGINRLDTFITVTGRADNAAATGALCRALFEEALTKSVGNRFAGLFDKARPRFIFYASQYRPSKNVITLLRAFDNLLKRGYRGLKLILTGSHTLVPEIREFIQQNNIETDVLSLDGLTVQQLAACYRLADLAVNPSLSEGGFPFSFAEALSVGTPIVMARIEVTDEILRNEDFYADMTFDPYDWRDVADRIEWALDHRDALLERQSAFYEAMLANRTWRNTLDDHIRVLDQVAASPKSIGATPAPIQTA